MKDFRFYVETLKDENGETLKNEDGWPVQTVNALYVGPGSVAQHPEGLAGVFAQADSPVCWTGFSWEYLEECRRISEATAREIHPALFERLDSPD
jgi:hypothetical protein